MNILLLVATLFMFLSGNKKNMGDSASALFGSDVLNIFKGLGDLTSGGNQTGAILELLSNPAVFEIVKNLLFKEKPKAEQTPPEQEQPKDKTENKPYDIFRKDTAETQKSPIQDEMQKDIVDGEPTQADEQPTTLPAQEETQESTSDLPKTPPRNDGEWFFEPVGKIATTQIKQQLYSLYDNWYIAGK